MFLLLNQRLKNFSHQNCIHLFKVFVFNSKKLSSSSNLINLFFAPSPYAKAATVGSLIIFITLSPGISPAIFVASFWVPLKYAGTVINTFFISWPNYSSAFSFNLFKTIDEITSGKYDSSFSLTLFFSLKLFYFYIISFVLTY